VKHTTTADSARLHLWQVGTEMTGWPHWMLWGCYACRKTIWRDGERMLKYKSVWTPFFWSAYTNNMCRLCLGMIRGVRKSWKVLSLAHHCTKPYVQCIGSTRSDYSQARLPAPVVASKWSSRPVFIKATGS
jgi:hypothetical protein